MALPPFLKNAAIGAAAGLGGVVTGGGALKQILANNSEITQIQEELLAQMAGRARDLRRIERGDFTPQESNRIAKTATEAVQPALASRGLSRSPVAAEAISGAVGTATANLQAQAGAQLTGLELATQQVAASLMNDDSFFSDLGAITQNLTLLQGLNQSGSQQNESQAVNDATQTLYSLLAISGGFGVA